MTRLTIKLFLSFFLIFTRAFGIIECQKLNEILPLIEEDTLVVFNINNVLTVSLQDAGSTPWAEEHIARISAEKNIPKPHATNLFIPLWHDILIASDVELFDPEAEAIVRYLQTHNVKVMALTNRYVEMGYPTHRNLRSVGIDFAKNPPHPEDFFLKGTESPAKYIEGIIFNGLINFKGDSLAAFLKEINYYPKKLIYIEDKPKHLAQVEKTITAMGIPFVGIHFGALELQRQAYRPELADIQVKYHFDILDDNAALKLYNRFQSKPFIPGRDSPLLFRPLPEDIYLVSSLEDIEKSLQPHTLVVSELDHTLWEAPSSIASRSFLTYLIEKNLDAGNNEEIAYHKATRCIEKVHRRAQVHLTDKNWPAFFNSLPAQECKSIAISFRPTTLLQRTHEQADNLGLYFHSPFKHKNSLLHQGIICAETQNSQFDQFTTLLASNNFKPSQIVGISATLSDLIQLKNRAQAQGIPFKGFLYSSKVATAFIGKEEILNLQQELLDRLLTNEEAAALLTEDPRNN